MADFELLAPGGHQKLVDEVVDRLDLKPDSDGYYAQLTAGAADNLTGRGDTTTAEFLYRTAGGTADIETGQAVAKSIKGNTLVWNQLRAASDGLESQTINGVTFTKDNDGSVTVSGTPTANGNLSLKMITSGSIPSLHKVLVRNACPAGGSSSTYYAGIGGSVADTGNGGITTFDTTATTYFRFDYRNGATIPETKLWPQLFDLTAMFGAGNEPSTVAEFEALYPEPYYEYDAGSLLPVRMTGLETTGFNQWDEVAEDGYISDTTGENVGSNTAYLRSKGYIPVFPGMAYHFTCTTGNNGGKVYYYDADKAFLSFEGVDCNGTDKTPPANARYMRFWMNYPGSYNNDICINLSWSGRRNGEYEPYWQQQRTIHAGTLRSAGTVYDEQTETERIVRVGEVDLGTLTWGKISTTSPHWRFTANLNTMAAGLDMTCAKYDVISPTAQWQGAKGISAQQSGSNFIVMVSDEAYTDPAAFKTAMSGVMLHYALATPTTTPIDPPLNLSYRVDDFGTERIMVPEDERSAPPVLSIAYGLNVVDFVRRAPTQYISAASFAQYLLARDAHDGTTTTMTWDDTNNRYEFTITDVETEG